MNEETSESGEPIWRYQPPDQEWVGPNMEDSQMEDISKHIERHIGKISQVWHEIVSNIVHIDVHEIAPTNQRPYWTLVTSGMSDIPMKVSEEHAEWRYAELMLCLPKQWTLNQTDFKDEKNYWPVRWLKNLARFPHLYKTWLCWGHSMPNGDPPEHMAANAPFTGIVLLRPKTVSTDFWTLKIREDKTIHFFSVMPLYPGEIELKLKHGAEELDRRFEKQKITEIIELKRRDVSKVGWRLW